MVSVAKEVATTGAPAPRPSNRAALATAAVEPRSHLRAVLVTLDALAIALAWSAAFVAFGRGDRTLSSAGILVAAATVGGIWLQYVHCLYQARVSVIRTMEMARLGRVALLLTAGTWAGARIADVRITWPEIVLGAALTLALSVAGRSIFRGWLSAARRNGRYVRNVVIVGANADGAELVDLLTCHGELGFRVVGVLGERDQAIANGLGGLWCGVTDAAPTVLRDRRATGALVAATALEPHELNFVVRRLQARGAHVQISSGVRGIDSRRLRALPLAYEPMFYVEPATLSRRQLTAKRVIDVAAAGFGLLLTAPLFALVAVLIKLQDRGPVFFKQTRVGTNGKLFKCYKFRTMVVDAESKLEELHDHNERNGPLFKVTDDPRVTRIGRILRDSSLDELPQIINVLRGEMSVVGPRPALPAEVAKFDETLLAGRTSVRPGITGLWQVEARDNPSFSAYRRLDLYYVENWSVLLDLAILVGTAEQVTVRLLSTLARRRRSRGVVEADATEAATA
jgi:exopolysaccharide biosynthesis polyprenyl glycosylphosphotransferase